jgi:hypothetical protein
MLARQTTNLLCWTTTYYDVAQKHKVGQKAERGSAMAYCSNYYELQRHLQWNDSCMEHSMNMHAMKGMAGGL